MNSFVVELDNNYLFNSYNYDLLKYDSVIKKEKYFDEVGLEDIFIESECTRKTENLLKVVLNMSNDCNLKCKYCYASHGTYGRKENIMSLQTMNNIISDLKNRGIKHINLVSFFGGEPLINIELIKLGLKLFNKNFKVNKYEITTNATLVNKDMLKIFKNYNVLLNMSLDGPRDINDYLRGIGTYEKILKTISMAKEIDYNNLAISCTFTKKHIDFGYSLEELKSYLNEFDIKYNISPVITDIKDLQLVRREETEDNNNNLKINKEIKDSIEAILKKQKNYFINPYVHDILYPLINNTKSYTFCDELYTNLSLNYDYNGDIYNCFRFWGNKEFICSNEKLTVDAIREINIKDNHFECKECWSRFFCGVCIADIMKENLSMPYYNGGCKRRDIYKEIMNEIVNIIDEDPENFELLINNFPEYNFY